VSNDGSESKAARSVFSDTPENMTEGLVWSYLEFKLAKAHIAKSTTGQVNVVDSIIGENMGYTHTNIDVKSVHYKLIPSFGWRRESLQCKYLNRPVKCVSVCPDEFEFILF
jgi:hypothetical protein